jgi:hypothetical protein
VALRQAISNHYRTLRPNSLYYAGCELPCGRGTVSTPDLVFLCLRGITTGGSEHGAQDLEPW